MLFSVFGSEMSLRSCLNFSVKHIVTALSSNLSSFELPILKVILFGVDGEATLEAPTTTRNMSFNWHCMPRHRTSGGYSTPMKS